MENKNILRSAETTLVIEFDEATQAEIIFNSINPELRFSHNDRSTTSMILEDNILKLVISASDVVALRASINSYVRWIKLSSDILDI